MGKKVRMDKFLLISFSCWLIPFILKIYFAGIAISYPQDMIKFNAKHTTNTVDLVINAFSQNDYKSAFYLLFENNMKNCILNILGGAMLGIGTLFNLMFNGFVFAEVGINTYKMGLSISDIIKVTLPHSFELIGLWLSGAIGLLIAWKLMQCMRAKEEFTLSFVRQVGIYTFLVFVIILCAAYVEAYISVNILK